MKRARLYVPLVAAALLFGAYSLLLSRPPMLLRSSVRDALFGKDGAYVLFLAVVALIFFGVRLFDTLAFEVLLSRRQKMIVPVLLRQIVSLALYVFLFAIAMSSIFRRDVTGLLVSGTVVAAVLGLALQDTLGNLFAGISLHIEQAFVVGDVIRSGEIFGVVEGVNWRATRLRTFNNNILVIPNGVLSHDRLEVFPRGNLNARLVTVGISYDAPPAKVIRVLEQAASNIEGVAKENPCIARIGGFGESAVTYEIKYWTRNYERRDSIDAAIRRAVWYALRRNGMTQPYPIRMLHQAPPPAEWLEELSREQTAERINGLEILAPLAEDERAALVAGARVHHFSRGETLLGYGQSGDSMFVIHEGSVSVQVPTDGAFEEVAQLGPGAIFGEMALLTGESRTADVIALVDVIAIEIPKAAMRPVLEHNPALAAALSEKIARRRSKASARHAAETEEQSSLVSRIRSWFGLHR